MLPPLVAPGLNAMDADWLPCVATKDVGAAAVPAGVTKVEREEGELPWLLVA